MYKGPSFSPSSTAVFVFKNSGHSGGCEVAAIILTVLIYVSLVTSDFEHLLFIIIFFS
jgi:hypothetical protein